MKRRTIALSVALVLVALVAVFDVETIFYFPNWRNAAQAEGAPAQRGGQELSAAWARPRLWDDGLAEVALYDARRPQYGKIESYEAVFIVTKEDFNPQLNVKADTPYAGKQLLPVLKFNAYHSYWTANYPYHFLLSAFVRRDDPSQLVKLTLGSQEWCGNTFKLVRPASAGRAQLVYHTYWDGEGDGTRALEVRAGDLYEDQLPVALRGLRFATGTEVRRRIVPSLIGNSARGGLEPVEAVMRVTGEETLATPAGRIAAWRVSVERTGLEQTWWFEKAAPHMLVKMESSDGRAWTLKSRTRKAYWQEPTVRPEM